MWTSLLSLMAITRATHLHRNIKQPHNRKPQHHGAVGRTQKHNITQSRTTNLHNIMETPKRQQQNMYHFCTVSKISRKSPTSNASFFFSDDATHNNTVNEHEQS